MCLKHLEEIEPLSSWLKLAAVVVLNSFTAIPLTTYGIFYDYLQEHYGSNTAVIGWIFFVYYISTCIMGKLSTMLSFNTLNGDRCMFVLENIINTYHNEY